MTNQRVQITAKDVHTNERRTLWFGLKNSSKVALNRLIKKYERIYSDFNVEDYVDPDMSQVQM